MITVVSNELMRFSDAETIRKGTSGRELMRRAGEALVHALPEAESYLICVGTGNNGGDGYQAALLLKTGGKNVKIVATGVPKTALSKTLADECTDSGICCEIYDGSPISAPVILDCIFGTGFSGEAEGIAKELIEAINTSHAFVVSADINSGLSGDNGVGKTAVRSDLTVAIGACKAGHFLGDAKDRIGQLCTADIGIELVGEPYHLMEAKDFRDFFPPRKHNAHKYAYGTAAILGGSVMFTGAVKLANLAASALLSGAGLSKLIVPKEIAGAVAPYLLESTLVPLESFDEPHLGTALDKTTAVAAGMGFGRNEDRSEAIRYLMSLPDLPVLIDADGLYWLKKAGFSHKCRLLITPHAAEFANLTDHTVSEVLNDPIGLAVSFARENRMTVLLKGPTTVVTDGSRVLLVDRGTPGMATAGSGDVLSGIIAGILATRPDDVLQGAALGAWIAGRAGELAEAEKTAVSMVASDTVRKIPDAVKEIVG